MSITVHRELRQELEPEATLLLRVLADVPQDRLVGALSAVRKDLMALNDRVDEEGIPQGPKFVDTPLPVPGGQIMMVDFGDTLPQALRVVPEMVVRRLAEAGITDAEVRLPRVMGDRHGTIWAFAPAARAFRAVRGGRTVAV